MSGVEILQGHLLVDCALLKAFLCSAVRQKKCYSCGTMRGNSGEELVREVMYGRLHGEDPGGPPMPQGGDKYVILGLVVGAIVGAALGSLFGRLISYLVAMIAGTFVGGFSGTLIGDRILTSATRVEASPSLGYLLGAGHLLLNMFCLSALCAI